MPLWNDSVESQNNVKLLGWQCYCVGVLELNEEKALF